MDFSYSPGKAAMCYTSIYESVLIFLGKDPFNESKNYIIFLSYSVVTHLMLIHCNRSGKLSKLLLTKS